MSGSFETAGDIVAQRSGTSIASNQPKAAVVQLSNIVKAFGQLEVLKDVSLSAHEGEVVTLIGSSGSGKSTCLRCINLLETPSGGRLQVDGETIDFKGSATPDRAKVSRIRMRLGMVFQQFNLWSHKTVMENVIEAPMRVHGKSRAEAVEHAEALLQRVGLYEKRNAYPAFLSGGQQQRAGIARALAIEPKVMLMDEPTSALDPELVGEVLKVIRGLAEEGRTMVLVTHELRFARQVSNRIMFLERGRVEEEGTPDEIFLHPKSDRCRQFIRAADHNTN